MSTKMTIAHISSVIDKKLLEELLKEYDMTKRFHFLEDWEKSVLHSGKFSELIMAVVKNIVDGDIIDINDIHFDQIYNSIMNRTKTSAEEEILMLAIPRVARSVYDIRNKKRVAHVKAIDPNLLDSQYCVSGCDWMLSQFVMLYSQASVEETAAILHSLVEKQIPFVEQFDDGTMVILKKGLSFKQQFLVCLYKLGVRTSKKELCRVLNTYNQLVNSTVKKLEAEKLVHSNDQGITLTKSGIRLVEDQILKR
jgi:hypothetical protein